MKLDVAEDTANHIFEGMPISDYTKIHMHML